MERGPERNEADGESRDPVSAGVGADPPRPSAGHDILDKET